MLFYDCAALGTPDVLPDSATARISTVLPTYGFAQHKDGANYLAPRSDLAVNQEVTGRVEVGLSGKLPLPIRAPGTFWV
jgi:hypothetical protein